MTDPTQPGPDELAVKENLIALVDGPRPVDEQQPIPPKPDVRPRDWLDDIMDTPSQPAPPEPEPEEPPAEPEAPKTSLQKPDRKPSPKPRRPRRRRPQRRDPAAPRSAWDSRPPAPRQSLIEAWDRIPYRLKWLAYHASAAYLGWSTGLVGWATYVTAWIARTGLVGPQAIFWYVAGAATLLLYRRTRSWWWPVAWLAAIPATSTVVGVLLYGTPHP